MKKTFITLLLASSVASAATSLTYWAGNTGNDILTVSGSNMPYLGNGNQRASKSVGEAIKTAGNTDYTLNFNVTDRDANSFAVNDAMYLNQITTTTATTSYSLSIAFGANGSITCGGSINLGSHVAGRTKDGVFKDGVLTLSATLSDAEVAALAAGDDVSRTLITTDHFTNTVFSKLADNTTLTLTGTDATYGGVILGVKNSSGKIAYYAANDVQTNGTGVNGATQWVRANPAAEELKLEDGKSYIVIGIDESISNGTTGYSSMKRVSYLVKAVPEPTTATLSLLALAGLCARRRRH